MTTHSPQASPAPLRRLVSRLFCVVGMHDWDGNTDPNYPAPRCRRCGRWYMPRNVVQKNIICGGDVCAGNIYRTTEPADAKDHRADAQGESK